MSGTVSQEQLRYREILWEGSWRLEAKVGLDEQESDIRLAVRGKTAMYAISPILIRTSRQ